MLSGFIKRLKVLGNLWPPLFLLLKRAELIKRKRLNFCTILVDLNRNISISSYGAMFLKKIVSIIYRNYSTSTKAEVN